MYDIVLASCKPSAPLYLLLSSPLPSPSCPHLINFITVFDSLMSRFKNFRVDPHVLSVFKTDNLSCLTVVRTLSMRSALLIKRCYCGSCFSGPGCWHLLWGLCCLLFCLHCAFILCHLWCLLFGKLDLAEYISVCPFYLYM